MTVIWTDSMTLCYGGQVKVKPLPEQEAMSLVQQPTLGVVATATPGAVEGDLAELAAGGWTTPWVVQDPTFWRIPIRTAIAPGTDAEAILAGTPAAVRGVVDAVRRLEPESQLIIGNCGFMWAARRELAGTTAAPTMVSALDLLDLAFGMTSRPIGVLTYSEPSLATLLRDHPQRDRLRLVGLEDLPDWAAASTPGGGWSLDGMAQQLEQRLADALAEGGEFEDITLLILECAWLPNFRGTVRSLTSLPVLDIVSFAAAALA